MDEKRAATLESAIAEALNLAELTERKAALLRQMAEGLAQERWPAGSAWHSSALDIAERMERQAASAKGVNPYSSKSGQPIACAWTAGRSAWTLAGKAIARRQAVALIAERMESRLS